MLSQVEIQYLEYIYFLQYEQKKRMTINSLAVLSGHKPPTVTATLKRLNKKSAVLYQPYKGYKLTDFGKKIAVQKIRGERIWQYFLMMNLGYNWLEIIKQRNFGLESDPMLIARLEQTLDYPKVCPFGKPIPDSNGFVQDLEWQTLEEGSPQTTYRIMGVNTEDPAILMRIIELGIAFQSEVKLIDKALIIPTHRLEIEKRKIELPKELAKHIWVKSIKVKRGFFS